MDYTAIRNCANDFLCYRSDINGNLPKKRNPLTERYILLNEGVINPGCNAPDYV